jgi:hydroxymethylpyrimidine/phosphomethylpyrimidine kinase
VLKENQIGRLIPEVQSNIGIGLPGAQGAEDVAAIPGRIVKNGNDIFTVAAPQFGASQHVAKIVLTAMHFDPEMRAVMNIKFTDSILKACKKLKFKIASFDRAREPKSVKQREGSSLEWGTHQAITDRGYVPDIIYDLGGQGKEEMIRVLARDIGELVDKVLKINRSVEANYTGREKDTWRVR